MSATDDNSMASMLYKQLFEGSQRECVLLQKTVSNQEARIANLETALQAAQASGPTAPPSITEETLRLQKELQEARDQAAQLQQASSTANSVASDLRKQLQEAQTKILRLEQDLQQARSSTNSMAPVQNVAFVEDGMDLDTMYGTETTITWGAWLLHYARMRSVEDPSFRRPDKWLIRLWTGVRTPADQRSVASKKGSYSHFAHRMRECNFADAQELPYTNTDGESKEAKMSRFTGFLPWNGNS